MGVIKHHFEPDIFQFRSATAFPTFLKVDGTSSPVTGLWFDATTEQAAFLRFRALNYGSGNWTALIGWYADTATSGGVTWGIKIAAMTGNTDVQDVETKAFDTETTVSDTHLGTVGQRPHDISVALSNLDSVTMDDWVILALSRKPADVNDTMSGYAIITMLDISYSDT